MAFTQFSPISVVCASTALESMANASTANARMVVCIPVVFLPIARAPHAPRVRTHGEGHHKPPFVPGRAVLRPARRMPHALRPVKSAKYAPCAPRSGLGMANPTAPRPYGRVCGAVCAPPGLTARAGYRSASASASISRASIRTSRARSTNARAYSTYACF